MKNRVNKEKRCSLDKWLFLWYNLSVEIENIFSVVFISFDEILLTQFPRLSPPQNRVNSTLKLNNFSPKETSGRLPLKKCNCRESPLFQPLTGTTSLLDVAPPSKACRMKKFQSQTGGVQVTHLWKSGISPIVSRAALREKQEQVTWQLKSGPSFDQQSSK